MKLGVLCTSNLFFGDVVQAGQRCTPTHEAGPVQPPERGAGGKGVPERAHHGIGEDGTNVVEEQPAGHEVP